MAGRPLQIPVLLGTVRRGRASDAVAELVASRLAAVEGVRTGVVDIGALGIATDDAGEAIKDAGLATTISTSDGLAIVAPEYNHGYPGMLKHVLDSNYWEYVHRAVGVVGVSSGPLGGARMIENLVPVLKAVGLVPILYDVNVADVMGALDEQGDLRDRRSSARLDGFIAELVWMARTLRLGRDTVPNEALRARFPAAAPACPNDGAALNRHGTITRAPLGAGEAVDSDLGEVVAEVSTCPVCGYTAGRPTTE